MPPSCFSSGSNNDPLLLCRLIDGKERASDGMNGKEQEGGRIYISEKNFKRKSPINVDADSVKKCEYFESESIDIV